ncbi:unnamed protein product [Spirodela intermedia]|uniref:Uncharacterized protein n=1 Tax=Spirodela intermedia TaxID=51605 RepID=A0A7I8ICA4_SPIIN|nr:unnamed protein product [Spirodela intermedia]CAA6654682.1 unnamed protein product [Spirodela intermedia]
MEVMSDRPASALNPDAPLFVPMAYRAVEDFSDEWWDLVKSTAWSGITGSGNASWRRPRHATGPGSSTRTTREGEDGEKGQGREMVSWGAEKWRGMRCLPRTPSYTEKVPRIVKMKPSPRTIQQPR